MVVPRRVSEMSKLMPNREAPKRGGFSARRKTDSVVRILRGEDLEAVSRELGVTAATLSSWRAAFLDGGSAEDDASQIEILSTMFRVTRRRRRSYSRVVRGSAWPARC